MTVKALPASALRPLLIGVAAVILTMGMRGFADILNQFFLAIFLLLICLPIRRWLLQRGLSGILTNTILIVGVAIGMFALMGFLAISIGQLAARIPTYEANLAAQYNAIETWLANQGVAIDDLLALEIFSPGRIFEVILGFLVGLVPVVASLIFTLFIFAFAVIDADSFPARLRRGLPADSKLLDGLTRFSHTVVDFLRIKAVLGAITAAGNLVMLLFLGIDFALLWTVVTFLTSFIPFIGYWLALIPPTILAFLEFGWERALIVFILYYLINGIADNVIGPRMLGVGLNLSEVATLVVVIYWGWVLGPIGALLALPLTVAVKLLILEQYNDTRWLALAMSAGNGHSQREVPPSGHEPEPP